MEQDTVGLAVGTGLALAFGRMLASVAQGMRPTDPAAAGATAAVLVVVAVLACWLPARRAARVDPMTTLKAD